MNARQTSSVVGVGLLVFALVAIVAAEEPESAARITEALRITTDAAKQYELELVGPPSHRLELHPESILRWSNPVAGEVYGNVFVWTHEGRPEVIGSFHKWYSPLTHGSHEFHSLAISPIGGTRDGEPVWKAEQPGIVLHRVAQQQPVAKTELGRLRQMRVISRRFTVQKTDRKGVSREMRLLPKPIYRYGSNDSRVLEGGLFVFVQGTDPEVFLLVEARQSGNKWEWQYSLARMNSEHFVAKYQDREVWCVEIWPWSKVKNGREPYTIFGPFDQHFSEISGQESE
jgi:hypothetical protein